MKSNEKYILKQLRNDPEFEKYMKKKLTGIQKRMMNVSEVKKKKKKTKQLGLDNWLWINVMDRKI